MLARVALCQRNTIQYDRGLPFPVSFIASVPRHLALIDIEFACYASTVKKKRNNVGKVEHVHSEPVLFFFLFSSFNSPTSYCKILYLRNEDKFCDTRECKKDTDETIKFRRETLNLIFKE